MSLHGCSLLHSGLERSRKLSDPFRSYRIRCGVCIRSGRFSMRNDSARRRLHGREAGGRYIKKRSATVVADAGNITAVSDGRQDRASPLLRV